MKYQIHNQYITFIIDELFNNKSIEEFFHYFHLSRKTIHLLKQNKEYQLNGNYISSETLLKTNNKLTIRSFEKDDQMYPPTFSTIDIIYEDDFLLIVNKPAYLPIYPDSLEKRESLNHYVSYYYQTQGYDYPIRPIHRLDNDTTGLVIYCKCALLQPLLDYRLSKKEIQRHYLAIVEGQLDKKKYTVHTYIATDRHHSSKVRVSKKGKEAITHYQCLKSYKSFSLVECLLETGRKHQIRVHMSSIGHPLLGDPLYGHSSSYVKRQALHAYLVEMIHPITLEKLYIECPLPKDFQFLNKLKS